MAIKNRYIMKIMFGIFYCLLGSELFFRLFAPQPMIPRHVCATSYGIRGNTPNKTYWHIGQEYKVKLHTNSKGIRADREIPYDKPENVKRVVLLGDSFGMGYEVSYEDMFSTRLEYYLREKYGITTEVINLSTSGHGNAEELIVLENEGLKYVPDLVLLAWNGTDYDDNVRSDLFGLQVGRLYQKNPTYLPAVGTRERLAAIPLYEFTEQYSNTYSFFREYAGARAKEWLAKMKGRQIGNHGVQTQPDNNYAEVLTLTLLSEINRICIEKNIKFMILDIPNRKGRSEFYSSFPKTPDSATAVYPLYCPMDDFEPFRGQKIYWEKGHGHFTPQGSDIVGKGLADYIMNNHMLK